MTQRTVHPRTTLFLMAVLTTSAGAATTPAHLTLSSPTAAWTLGPTQSASTTVQLGGLDPAARLQLTFEGTQAGPGRTQISAAFAAQKGAKRTVKLTVGPDVPVGTYTFTLRARAGSATATLPVRVTVERWLLVDADRSANNTRVTAAHRPDPQAKDSALDQLIKQVVAGKVFDTYAVKQGSMASDTAAITGPDLRTLNAYSHVLWYTGAQTDQTPVKPDFEHMRAFMQGGNRKLILISPALILTMGGAANVFQSTTPDPQDPALLEQQKRFLKDLFGADGYHGTYVRNPYLISPAAGKASIAPFQAAGGNSVRGAFRPAEDRTVQSLLTAPVQDQRDVTSTGSIAIRRTGAGEHGSSSGVFLAVSPDLFQGVDTVRLLRTLFLS